MANNSSLRTNHSASRGDKVKTLDELSRVLARLKASGKTIIHCHGVFDLLHPGHISHLEAAKRRGDVLVVTVTRDEHVNKGPGRPVFTQKLRAESLAALGCVDFVAVNETATAVEAIRRLRPDFFVKGQDYRDASKDVTRGIQLEKQAAASVGARVVFTSEPMMSSTKLLNNHFGVYPEEAQPFLKALAARHDSDDIIARLGTLRDMKALVIGEAIVDEYHYCQAIGKSPKETIVATRFLREECFAGGSLAAANHMAGFAGEVHLATCLGRVDSREAFIRSRLKSGVKPHFFMQDGTSTIIKRRFVEPNFLTKMFEVCYLEDREISERLESRIADYLDKELGKFDAVLVTDYGHGMLTRRLIDLLAKKARFLAVNAQTNSANIGYNVITRWPRADYVCIDEPEIRLAERDKSGAVEKLLLSVARKMKAERMVVTRGHNGSLVYSRKEGFTSIPVLSQKVVDRTGAGDAYLSVSALCVAKGFPMELAGFIGNAAGALKVGTVCNRTPIEPVALYKFITAMLTT